MTRKGYIEKREWKYLDLAFGIFLIVMGIILFFIIPIAVYVNPSLEIGLEQIFFSTFIQMIGGVMFIIGCFTISDSRETKRYHVKGGSK